MYPIYEMRVVNSGFVLGGDQVRQETVPRGTRKDTWLDLMKKLC